jgi:low affinity Fe/Cu permease
MNAWFDRFTRLCAHVIGHPITITLFIACQLVWIAIGTFYGFTEPWHLWMMTPLTVLTAFALMPLQYSQNKDTAEIKAMVKEIAEDLPDVDAERGRKRAAQERDV